MHLVGFLHHPDAATLVLSLFGLASCGGHDRGLGFELADMKLSTSWLYSLKMLGSELQFVEYEHSYTKLRLWWGVVALANARYFRRAYSAVRARVGG